MRTIKLILTATAFLFAVQLSRPAFADVTITGTVGEIGMVSHKNGFGGTDQWFQFKLTDVTQTSSCLMGQTGSGNSPSGYAYFLPTEPFAHEWYAGLLVSKKGAPVGIVLDGNTTCHVTSVTLP